VEDRGWGAVAGQESGAKNPTFPTRQPFSIEIGPPPYVTFNYGRDLRLGQCVDIVRDKKRKIAEKKRNLGTDNALKRLSA
jgi:hypothetical protein